MDTPAPLEDTAPLEDPFDRIAEAVDPPMIVVTASAHGEDTGCLAGFHSQSSIEPRRWALWISKANHSAGVVREAPLVGVHFLSADQHDLAELFGTTSGDEIDKFTRCETIRRRDVPMLAECDDWVLGRRVSAFDEGGDHVCITIEPVDVGASGGYEPLRLAAVADLEPGHDADEARVHGR